MLTSYSSMLTSSGLIRSSLARATFIMLLHLERGAGRKTSVSNKTVSHGEVLLQMKRSTLPQALTRPNESLFSAERRSETLLRRLLLRPHAHINLIILLKIEEKGEINFSLMNMD